jgi:hypothetical protein
MNEFVLELNGSGIVLFDPVSVEQFCTENNITTDNIMDHFMENPSAGDKAIKEGIILPVYTIPPLNYSVRLQTDKTLIPDNKMKFSYPSFPLSVISGKLIAADIYAIMEWDAAYYKALKAGAPEFPTQFAYLTEPGNYAVDINGFYEKNNGNEYKGYEFVLKKMDHLPEIDTEKDIDSYNYNLI